MTQRAAVHRCLFFFVRKGFQSQTITLRQYLKLRNLIFPLSKKSIVAPLTRKTKCSPTSIISSKTPSTARIFLFLFLRVNQMVLNVDALSSRNGNSPQCGPNAACGDITGKGDLNHDHPEFQQPRFPVLLLPPPAYSCLAPIIVRALEEPDAVQPPAPAKLCVPPWKLPKYKMQLLGPSSQGGCKG